MDSIHDIDNKLWIGKTRINLKQLLNYRENDERLKNVILLRDEDKIYDDEEQEILESVSKFGNNKSSLKPYFLYNSTDERALVEDPKCFLKTYQLQLDHAKKMISDRGHKMNYLMQLRTTRRELLMRHLALINRPTIEPSNPTNVQINNKKDFVMILVVQIWPQPNKHAKVKLEKEILFRANQSLVELRDQFKCQRDYGVPIDLSDDPEQAERIFRGELFKSGFFLIGNTFYNDMRDSNNIDLSSNIIDWASKEVLMRGEDGNNIRVSRGLGPFNSEKMEDKKFEDLQGFRLGCPYLFLHQGDCEHLFTISDIRYVANDRKLEQTKFPFVTATSIGRKTDNLRCYMCKNRPPHWYTRNNSRLPVDPFFFCENCFYSFNYDKDKKKVGQFQAYLYTSAFGIPDSVVMATNR